MNNDDIEKSREALLPTKLEIVIITYNRSSLLSTTLGNLAKSPFKACKITVLDNCSTDNSSLVARSKATFFKNFNVISNKVNIGGDANIIRAIEISTGVYTWVLCDDDEYDFSNCQDVIECILDEKYDLIHMGAHNEQWKYGGTVATPKDLIKAGYPYFKYSCFVPCNLFRTQRFYDAIIQAYSNICNWFPHMPFLIEFYTRNDLIYISKHRIVTAVIGNQSYSPITLRRNWYNTSKLLNKKEDKLIFQLNQNVIVQNNSTVSLTKMLFAYGINIIYNKNFQTVFRFYLVTNYLQTALLSLGILLSPVWYLKQYLKQTLLYPFSK